MELRNFSQIGRPVSLLGFGCMRFPTRKDGKIARREAKRLLDMAFDRGVNYYDTAYFYHSGESEGFINRVLAQRPREDYMLTSKLPTVLVHSLEDAQRLYAEQRVRLDRDYLDFYLLHNLNGARWQQMLDLGVVDWLMERQAAGEFRRFGFSFHGSYEEFETILTARPWDVCQIQLNYMDVEEQAGMRGYHLACGLGVPVIIMEPVKGGALAGPPEEVMDLLRRQDPARSAASWALRWAGSLPGVLTVLSGMSTADQVADNLATFGSFQPLNAGEQAAVEQAAAVFRQRVLNGCTGCKYCMPCPVGVDIPQNFAHWNHYGIYRNAQRLQSKWKELGPKAQAAACIACGQCESACPQQLPIRDHLKRVTETVAGLEGAPD